MRESLVFALAIAVGLLLLAMPGAATAIGGGAGDTNGILWGLSALPLGHVDSVLFPDGATLIVSAPPEVLLLAPLAAWKPLWAFNLWQLMHPVLAAAFTFAWLRRDHGQPAAVAGALIFALCGPMIAGIHNGNPDTTPLFWLPLVAWMAPTRPFVAGLMAGAAVWFNPYVGVMAGLLLALGLPRQARSLGALAIAAGVGGLYVGWMEWSLRAPDTMVRKAVSGGGSGAWLQGLVWPELQRDPQQGTVHLVYLGLVPLALALAGLREGAGRWRWLGVLGLGLVLGLGTVVHLDSEPLLLGETQLALPLRYLNGLPGLASLQLHYRYIALAALGLAVLAARGIEQLPWFRARWIAVALVLVDLLRPVTDGRLLAAGPVADSGACALLEGREEGAVLNLPLGHDERWMREQACHGRPVAQGINRPASRQVQEAVRDQDLYELGEIGFRWLILHDPELWPNASPVMAEQGTLRLVQLR